MQHIQKNVEYIYLDEQQYYTQMTILVQERRGKEDACRMVFIQCQNVRLSDLESLKYCTLHIMIASKNCCHIRSELCDQKKLAVWRFEMGALSIWRICNEPAIIFIQHCIIFFFHEQKHILTHRRNLSMIWLF